MSETPDLQPLLVRAKCKKLHLRGTIWTSQGLDHRLWKKCGLQGLELNHLKSEQGMNLQRDSSHQGFPYHQSQEALSIPRKALKPKKLRSSSCLPHRNHFSLHLSFKHRHHLVCASFERAMIISPDSELLQLWDGLETDQLLFSKPFQPLQRQP